MPNVRASSGMIGTIRGPSSGSRIRLRRSRVNTMVVETAVWLPAVELGVDVCGRGRAAARSRTTRLGSGAAERPPALEQVLDLLGASAPGGSTARP